MYIENSLHFEKGFVNVFLIFSAIPNLKNKGTSQDGGITPPLVLRGQGGWEKVHFRFGIAVISYRIRGNV